MRRFTEWSCYRNEDAACGTAIRALAAARIAAGADDPILYEKL